MAVPARKIQKSNGDTWVIRINNNHWFKRGTYHRN